MVKPSANSTATILGFSGVGDPEYKKFVGTFKKEWLRGKNKDLLIGPLEMVHQGRNDEWEQGLKRIYVEYPEIWSLEKFGGSHKVRRDHANQFMTAQTKKVRQEMKQEETEKKRPKTRIKRSKTREDDSDGDGDGEGPVKRVKMVDLPTLKFPDFNVWLSTAPCASSTSYNSIREFTDLVTWVRQSQPALTGKTILIKTEIMFRDEEYCDLLGIEKGSTTEYIISNQGTWNSAVTNHEANRRKPDSFAGFTVQALDVADSKGHRRRDEIEPDVGSEEEDPSGKEKEEGREGKGQKREEQKVEEREKEEGEEKGQRETECHELSPCS